MINRDLLAGRLAEDGHHLADRRIVTDDLDAIRSVVNAWVQTDLIDVVIATGGTGSLDAMARQKA